MMKSYSESICANYFFFFFDLLILSKEMYVLLVTKDNGNIHAMNILKTL